MNIRNFLQTGQSRELILPSVQRARTGTGKPTDCEGRSIRCGLRLMVKIWLSARYICSRNSGLLFP